MDEANERLKRRRLEKKTFARGLAKAGHAVSEMMVLRALHPDAKKRIATIETLDVISDALGLPRPVVVADSLSQALELQAVLSFNAADADRLRLSAEIDHELGLQAGARSGVDGSDGRTTRSPRAVDDGRAAASSARSEATRRPARAR
ncbi:MAG TPA: hypothetical protein VFD36_10445 [Kofleriaceae bacterium]|nr:hypothetical protein [Kofleriaceae bacterium]